MIKWKKRDIPSIYLLVYKLMKAKAGNNLFIEYSDVKELLSRRLSKLPNVYYYMMLKEMEELKLIKKIGNWNYIRFKFIACDADKLLNQYSSFFTPY